MQCVLILIDWLVIDVDCLSVQWKIVHVYLKVKIKFTISLKAGSEKWIFREVKSC